MTATAAIFCSAVSIGLALAWPSLLRLSETTVLTTTHTAWRWAVAAAGVWTLTWSLDHATALLAAPAADHLWYASAVVALCPAMAVLGSRRPGTRVWTTFIQIPMLFVLGWPSLALLLQGHEIRGLQLETPQLAAYFLVLVMGAGNYLGTRYTLSSICYFTGLGLLVLGSSAAAPGFFAHRGICRAYATGLVSVAVIAAARTNRVNDVTADRFNRLWLDFFNQFGVVWGRRIQDRVNHVAAKEQWPGRLELHGFEWSTAPDHAIQASVEHTFRWLLRRFVDPGWINERLGPAPDPGPVVAMTTDS